MSQLDIDDFLDNYAETVTWRDRAEFSGAPTVTVSNSGGTLSAGTYYWRVTPWVSGEQAAGGWRSGTVTANGSISLTWGSVSSATLYSIYRSNDTNFNSPCLLGTINALTYNDIGGATSTGNPPTTGGDPYVYYVEQAMKAICDELRRDDILPKSEVGYLLENFEHFSIERSATVEPMDHIVRASGATYEVQKVVPNITDGTIVNSYDGVMRLMSA